MTYEFPKMPDHDAPYVCLGCSEKFAVCPDFDAHNCPKCGEKVAPKKLLNMRERVAGTYVTCNGDCRAEVFRASGDVLCTECGELYREHKYCVASGYEEGVRVAYAAHVLCDGRHVHL